jgi:hypothetical protein
VARNYLIAKHKPQHFCCFSGLFGGDLSMFLSSSSKSTSLPALSFLRSDLKALAEKRFFYLCPFSAQKSVYLWTPVAKLLLARYSQTR